MTEWNNGYEAALKDVIELICYRKAFNIEAADRYSDSDMRSKISDNMLTFALENDATIIDIKDNLMPNCEDIWKYYKRIRNNTNGK